MALPAVYKVDGSEPSIDMLLAGHRISNETEQGKRVDIRIHGLNTGSAQLTVFTTGSTQNGTAFDQQSNSLSYNKTLAGAAFSHIGAFVRQHKNDETSFLRHVRWF